MRRTLIVHGIWFIAVVAAFAAGYMLPKQGGDSGSTVNIEAGIGDDTFGPLRTSAREKWVEIGDGEAMRDAQGFLAELQQSGPGRVLTEDDILELGKRFKSELDPIEKRMAFGEMLKGMTSENALLIREQIEHLSERSPEFMEFHYAWGAIDGQKSMTNGAETSKRDMAASLGGWASTDPGAAIAWFKEFTADEKQDGDHVIGGLVHGLANKDFVLATDFAFQLAEAGNKQAHGMLNIVTHKVLRTKGAEEAALWAENLPDGPMRASAMDRVAHDFVAKDPEAAAAWAERYANNEHSARVIEEVGDEWAERDPVASINWIESLDAGKGKSSAFSSAMGEWVRKDPKAASEYLAAMPQSAPERDSAISGFVSRLAYEDPTSAITWAGEINDVKQRESTLVRAGQAYFRKDPVGAMEWLVGSGLPLEAQGKVLNASRGGDYHHRR